VDHVVADGFDHRRGGVYRAPATDAAAHPTAHPTDKVWWAQAETVAALTDAIVERDDPRHVIALAQLLDFVERHQTDPADGVWIHTVTERGRRRVPRKSDAWKVGYHEVRAIVKLVDAFATSPTAP
jgi:mannose/cellobiose epimerase-like protein (N-acyl-D-glucosamine 2-epimerase family)